MSAAQALPDPALTDLEARRRELRRAIQGQVEDPHRLIADVTGLLDERAARPHATAATTHPLTVARRVDAALERLRAAPTLEELERSLPSELSWAGHFDRVLFSRIHLSTWRPVSWHSAKGLEGPAQDRFRELVRGPEMPLSGGSVEAEVVRRRVSALVLDADATVGGVVPIIGVVGSNSYVVAPVVVGDEVRVDGDVSGAEGSLGRIAEVLDRRTVLRRTADDDDPIERIVVANADQLVVVTALADPPPRPALIDRTVAKPSPASCRGASARGSGTAYNGRGNSPRHNHRTILRPGRWAAARR